MGVNRKVIGIRGCITSGLAYAAGSSGKYIHVNTNTDYIQIHSNTDRMFFFHLHWKRKSKLSEGGIEKNLLVVHELVGKTHSGNSTRVCALGPQLDAS